MVVDPVAISISIPAIVLLALICYADEKSEAVKHAKFLERRILESGTSIHDLIYDPPLSERELQVVYRDHTVIEHRCHLPILLGWMSVVFGVSFTYYELTGSEFSLIISVICMLIELPLFILFLIQTAKPCQCGFTKILSRHERSLFSRIYRPQFHQSLRSKFASIALVSAICISIITIMLGIGSLFVLIFQGLCTSGHIHMAAAFAAPTAVLAALVFAATIVKPKKRFIPVIELDRMISLEGANVSELEELVEFYSHIGNFERADHFSRKLISHAEQSRI